VLWDYGVYGTLSFSVPVLPSADSYSRFVVKASEVTSSVNIVRRLLPLMPHTAQRVREVPGPVGAGKGVGVVEAPRGQLAYAVWMTQDGEHVERVAIATPSARNWHVVPAAMANGNILQDFPIIEASFLLSVAGWDQ
jgi:Ni,Fe-hydrogenase III large subunit